MAPANAPPPSSPARDSLPVLETAAEVIRTYLGLITYLPRLALVPFTATFLAQGAMVLFARPVLSAEADAAPQFGLAHAATAVVIVASYTMFLVDWHRLVLLGPGAGTAGPRLRLGVRDLRFFGHGVLVGLLSVLAALPAFILVFPFAGSLGGPLIPIAIAMALSLTALTALGIVLPAKALDRSFGLADAVAATRRVLGRVLALALLILLPAQLAVTLVALMVGGAAQAAGIVIPLLLVSLAVEYAAAALFATLLAVIYRRRAAV